MLHIETKFIKSGFCIICWDKFIKENLGCDEPKFTEFAPSLAKNQVLCRLLGQNLEFARLMAGFLHLALLYDASKCYEKFLKVACDASIAKLLISKEPCIDRATRAIKQKYPRITHGKDYQI